MRKNFRGLVLSPPYKLRVFANPDEQQAQQERQRTEEAEQARINAVSQLLATGMDVAQVAQILNFTIEEVRQISGS